MPIVQGFFVTARVDVHDSVIARFTMPGGSVFKFVHEVVKDAERLIKARVPFRTGELFRSIEARRPVSNKVFGCQGRVYAHAHYARWVNNGTRGPIRPRLYRVLRLAPWGRYPTLYLESVSGQRGQHFMEKGMGAAMALHNLH